MSNKLRAQLALERQLLHRQIDEYRALLEKCGKQPPTPVEKSALAVMLHSFYNGIENIFKRITLEYEGRVPDGAAAHRDLLDLMARATPDRPRVISESLCDALDPYLDFRHMLRHAYSFQLQWEKMEMLVAECESVLSRFDAEIDVFLAKMETKS